MERVDDAKAIKALCEGAKIGNLDQEERQEFTASETYDLKSPFLRALLEDENDKEMDSEEGAVSDAGVASSSGSGVAAASASAAVRRTIRPSQLAWDK